MKKLILFVMCLVVLMCSGVFAEITPEEVTGAMPDITNEAIIGMLQARLVAREAMRQEVIKQVQELNNATDLKERQLERLNGTVIELREHIVELTNGGS